MPHNHIFMDEGAVDTLRLTKTTGAHPGYLVDRDTSIEKFVAGIVKDAFRKHASEELTDDQIVQYETRLTNSMPVDLGVNVTMWYTPERAPHVSAIQQEIQARLEEWAPTLNIDVHVIVKGGSSAK